jgi:hypothetical protein
LHQYLVLNTQNGGVFGKYLKNLKRVFVTTLFVAAMGPAWSMGGYVHHMELAGEQVEPLRS